MKGRFGGTNLIALLNDKFELIQDEIDIDRIEEFEIVGCNIKLNDMILDKMNKLVQAVKQLNERVKKLEGKKYVRILHKKYK